MSDHANKIDYCIEEELRNNGGDVFKLFVTIYDYMSEEFLEQQNFTFYKKIFENVRTSQDTFFLNNIDGVKSNLFEEYISLIDAEKLKVKNREDLITILKILFTVTRKSVVTSFKCSSKEEARKSFLKQIEYLKYGMLKKEGE